MDCQPNHSEYSPNHNFDPHQETEKPTATPQDLLIEMILNNSRDVEYDPANSHRRCRLEWPRDSDTFFQYLKHYTDHSVSSSVREEATGFVQAAFNKCGGDAEQRQDDLDICGAFAYAKHKNKPLDVCSLLHALHYRNRSNQPFGTYSARLLTAIS